MSNTATNLWGNNWRMPTQAEFQALLDNCDVAWTDDYKSSTPWNNNNANSYSLSFRSTFQKIDFMGRKYGYSVRAVLQDN